MGTRQRTGQRGEVEDVRHWPLPDSLGFCVLVPDVLTRAECRQLIAQGEERGFVSAEGAYPPSYRNNDRLVLDDAKLATELLARLQGRVPELDQRPDALTGPAAWQLDGINDKLRYCRYGAGQTFHLHQDGVHHRPGGRQSRITLLVYLSDGDDVSGGDTLFHDGGPGTDARIVARVRPRAGSAILFDHALWHTGDTVRAGVKYILRSDLIYRPVTPVASPAVRTLQNAHDGYVWTLARFADGALASGGRDTVIRVWNAAGERVRELTGHTQSVLGLAVLHGERLASVSRDRSLRIWSREGGSALVVPEAHPAALLCVAAMPDGVVATGAADRRIRLWRDDGALQAELTGHDGWVWAVQALGTDRLVSASEDGLVRIWDVAARRCVQVLAGDAPLRTVAVSADGANLATGDTGGKVTLWQATLGGYQRQHRFQAHAGAVRCVRFGGAGVLLSGSEDGQLHVWSLLSRARLATLSGEHFITDLLPVDERACLVSSYAGRIIRHAWA